MAQSPHRRSSPHGIVFPATHAASFLLGDSCFAAAGFTRRFSWPKPFAPQAFPVSPELPAPSDARLRSAFRSRPISAPQASHRRTRSPSDIPAFACPQNKQVLVSGWKRGAITSWDRYHGVLYSNLRRHSDGAYSGRQRPPFPVFPRCCPLLLSQGLRAGRPLRNGWPAGIGIPGRHAPEHALRLPRWTKPGDGWESCRSQRRLRPR